VSKPNTDAVRTLLACPHHDKPLVCGECGRPWGWHQGTFHARADGTYPPAHRVDGVLVRCTA
jgi:hypothetical protein